jgi:hypothetical protein
VWSNSQNRRILFCTASIFILSKWPKPSASIAAYYLWVQQISGDNNVSGIAPNIYNGGTAGRSLFALCCLWEITRILEIVRLWMDKKEETLRILGNTVEMISWCLGSREEDRF